MALEHDNGSNSRNLAGLEERVQHLEQNLTRLRKDLTRLAHLVERLTFETASRQRGSGPTPTSQGRTDNDDHPRGTEHRRVRRLHRLQPEEPGTGTNLEQTIGDTWFRRIGTVALLVAGAFFVSFAHDAGWLGRIPQLVIAALSGGTLLSFACYAATATDSSSRSYLPFVVVTGFVLSYGSVIMAHITYGYFPWGVALAAYALLIAVTWWLSTLYDSLMMALLGLLGAFVAVYLLAVAHPLLSTSWSLPLLLVSLNLGVLAFTSKGPSLALVGMSLAGSQVYVAYWLWTLLPGQGAPAGAGTLAWLVLLHVLVALQIEAHNVMSLIPVRTTGSVLLVINTCLSLAWMLGLHSNPLMQSVSFWTLASLYLAVSTFLLRRRRTEARRTILYWVLGIALVTAGLTPIIQSPWTSVAWYVEGLCILTIGFRMDSVVRRTTGLAIVMLGWTFAAGHLVTAYEQSSRLSSSPVVQAIAWQTVLVSAVGVVAMFGLAAYYRAHKPTVPLDIGYDRGQDSPYWEHYVPPVLTAAGLFSLVAFLSAVLVMVLHRWSPAPPGAIDITMRLSIMGLWLLLGLVFFAAGATLRLRQLRIAAGAVLVLAGLRVSVDAWRFWGVYRGLAFLALGIVLLAISYWYRRYGADRSL